ncbi:MAG TPA: hypothetical protein VEC12_00785 [Bacteroidia bacterium]|nr:hypothetical protein [Bacteroidia bacterium]
MDLETIFYIAMFILFSVFSGAANRKKKKNEQENRREDNQGPTLEEEIRKMQEQILGKRETQAEAREQQRPISRSPYETLDDDQEETQRYKRIERENYSLEDIKKVERQYETYTPSSYKTEIANYENQSVDALGRGKEQHSVMDKKTFPVNRFDHSDEVAEPFDFDARKAFIYSEIFRRPEY